MEANYDTVNNSAIEQEITNVRDLVIQNGEKLDSVNDNINALGSIMAENEAESLEGSQEEQQGEAEQESDTYEELLISIESKIELSNQINAVHCAFFGIVCGLIAIKILIDRLYK